MAGAQTRVGKAAEKAPRSSRKASGSGMGVSEVSALFGHIADPVRLRILALTDEASRVEEIGASVAEHSSTIRDHLAILRDNGLVALHREGGQDLYRLTDRGQRVLELVRWLVYVPPSPEEPPDAAPIDPNLLDDVGGFVDDPEAWFRRPNAAFDGRRPIDLLGTPDERALRDRIEAAKLGMFS